MNQRTGKLIVFMVSGCTGPDGQPKKVNTIVNSLFSLLAVYSLLVGH